MIEGRRRETNSREIVAHFASRRRKNPKETSGGKKTVR